MNNLFSEIVEQLVSEKYFSVFKYRRRDCRLIKLYDYGFEAIEFQYWDGYDLLRDARAIVIKPLYLKRFSILHKWFEKYSFKTKTDQRDNYSIGFDGGMLGKQNEFYFLLNKRHFQEDLEELRTQITMNSINIFNKFSTLQALFEYQINPILSYKMMLPDTGADWVFEYLTLTRIVQPEKYEGLKEIILRHIQFMVDKKEPNVIEYYPRFTEITKYLETQQFLSP